MDTTTLSPGQEIRIKVRRIETVLQRYDKYLTVTDRLNLQDYLATIREDASQAAQQDDRIEAFRKWIGERFGGQDRASMYGNKDAFQRAQAYETAMLKFDEMFPREASR